MQDPRKPYDLSEEASRRPGEGATEAARQAESDEVNEETGLGPVDSKEGGSVEDRVSTSLSED